MRAIAELAPDVLAMEACASAHYWGRQFLAAGHRIRLINPRFVKPFVKGSKNDAADAEAIYEAASRPTMRFVPVKSIAQQDLQSVHRARERVVCTRTALINHMRGLLAEYGVILPQGAWRFTTQVTTAIEEAELSDLTREIFMDMLDQLSDLNRRLEKFDAQLMALCRTNEACRRLSKLPGVGPVIATALVAAVDDGRHFRSGRELAAWIGLVPRQYTTGGKPRLGGHWQARQSLPSAADDPRCLFRGHAVGQARRSPFRMAERTYSKARLQSNDRRACQQDGKNRLGIAHAKGGLCGCMIAAHRR
jgi:transposase